MNDYKSLNDVFFKINSNIYSIIITERQLNYKNLADNKKKEIIDNCKTLLKELRKRNNNKIMIQGFIDKNYPELIKIRDILIGINSKKNECRSLINIIFKNILGFDKHIPLGITIIFENFIKGITYFKDEIEKTLPIYHRASSCGNKKQNFRKLYLENNGTEEYKKNHIYKCYLERLIYDDMYRNLTLFFPKGTNENEHKQNEGHKYQLNERAKNFYNYFTGTKIDITIMYEGKFPTYLIIHYIKNNEIIKREEYIKITYIDDYGNTQYSDTVYKTTIENGNKNMITQEF